MNKYAVDCILPDGTWEYDSVLCPLEVAKIVANEKRKEHPDWLVEINQVDTANA